MDEEKKPVTLEELFETSKEVLLREGYHPTLLFVTARGHTYLSPVTEEILPFLTAAGEMVSKQEGFTVSDVESAHLVGEVSLYNGMAVMDGTSPLEGHPGEKYLLCMELRDDGEELKQLVKYQEILRAGGAVDLCPTDVVLDDQLLGLPIALFLGGVLAASVCPSCRAEMESQCKSC